MAFPSFPAKNAINVVDFEFAALSAATNYRKALLREFAPFLRGQVIEIGAGAGQMTGELFTLPTIVKLVPIEPENRFCALHRSQYPQCPIVQGTIADADPSDTWNAIVSINVLEHIEDDDAELAQYAKLLRSQCGYLCLFVPARPEIYAPIDKDFGHFRRYTKTELRKKLVMAGFEVQRIYYYNFIGYFAWWFNFCLLKERSFQVAKVKLFDRWIFPFAYQLESRLLRPCIGQNLLAIAKPRAT
jgi:SAM-dependent methyltransferase